MKFSTEAEVLFLFSDYETKQDVITAVNNTVYSGGMTYTADAFDKMVG